MGIWAFLKSESELPVSRLAAMAVVAGLSNALVLAIINSAAKQSTASGSTGQPGSRLFFAFVVTILCYILSQRFILLVTGSEVEKVIGKLRIRIVDKIRRADLMPLEELGRSQIFSVITRDTQTLSEAAAPAVIAIQSGILVIFTSIYIAWLSLAAFVVALLMIGSGILVHFRRINAVLADIQGAAQRENQFVSELTQLLEGFKEVKLNTSRSRELKAEMQATINAVATLKSRTGRVFADHYIFSQTVFYMTLAAVVFVLPRFPQLSILGVETRVTAALLFTIGPLSSLVGTIPTFSRTNVAAASVARLEEHLTRLQRTAADHGEKDEHAPTTFEEINFSSVRFVYRSPEGESAFAVGPISTSIRRGEMVFIVGGNGSGKSTFFKLLTSLYYPESGSIQLDGREISDLGYARYRNLFSTIFSDYFLFDKVVGVGEIPPGKVEALLDQMGLSEKTSFVNGRFVNQGLSTGQRKRLALIVALLEDRPIFIFDEWAADQDPTFRKHFYHSILPALKAANKTIVAATHDDHYFNVADRVLKMENGLLTEHGR